MNYLAFSLLTLLAATPFTMHELSSKSGQKFIRISNHTNNMVYCNIIGTDTRYFKEFYIKKRSRSRMYIKPVGQYYWKCR